MKGYNALKYLAEGKKIRLPFWNSNEYIEKAHKGENHGVQQWGIVDENDNWVNEFNLDNFLLDSWEIYEEEVFSLPEIKACPFCGCDVVADLYYYDCNVSRNMVSLQCMGEDCYAFFRAENEHGKRQTMKVLITRWNRRNG